MTKRTPPQTLSKRHSFRLGWKLVVLVSVGLCVIGLLKLQSELAAPPARGSRRIRADAFVGSPKVAFLFLARRDLPLDFLWQAFFENADVANFSIYIHSEPGFVFDESSTRSAFFYNRQLRNSIKVGWGESSMIGAERLLLEAALDDPANRRFVLLSDSFLDKKEGRYNPKMSYAIRKKKWRKGSQWITLIRRHAEVVADDDVIFPAFKKFCKRRPPIDASKGKQNS
ncbi:hypothetical protein RJ639_006053, partial [Escallonia herrerae]